MIICRNLSRNGGKNMEKKDKKRDEVKENPDYTPPKITSYTSEEIIEEIGPAQACTSAPFCPVQG
jgi:hypothetical protein